MMRTLRRTAAALTITAAGLGLAASAASAGELSMDPSTGIVTYDAYAGETNHVTITQTLGSVSVSDPAGVDLGVGCTGGVGTSPPHCDVLRPREIRVFLGNEDDTLDAAAVFSRMYVEGNWGDDDITTGSAPDTVYGGLGADTIHSRDGGDIVYGEEGEDILSGSNGNDELHGGTARDQMLGGAGADDMFGDGGDDNMNGADGIDELHGGSDDDTINGGPDADTFFGEAGSDTITSLDQLDGENVDCGASLFDDDFAHVDNGDIVRSNCDRVQRD